MGLPKLPYQRQCSNYLFHLVLDCSKIHKAPARAQKHQLVLTGLDLKNNDKRKILDCQILKKKLRSSWTQNWSTYTVCTLFFIFDEFDDSLSSTSSFWYQENQSKNLALLFRSLFQIMKARPGALEHELVLCIFDCFNKTIAFEQVNLEISLMATL